MELLLIVAGIMLVSIFWAYWSLKEEVKKREPDKHIKDDLAKGRVIFYSSSDESAS